MISEAYRHELKYLVSEAELRELRVRLRAVMRKDPHAGDKGTYEIRSIYFDDLDNHAYYENEDGVSPRSKWRIRSYNGSKDAVFLENKEKDASMTRKHSCPLTEAQFARIMEGGDLSSLKDNDPVLNRFLIEMKTKPLFPKVIVRYEREPYLFPSGNVRVTFDRDIASGRDFNSFFATRFHGRNVMPLGRQILEVKYDAYLPDHIYHAVQMRNMQQETYSKYYFCRRFVR